MPFRFVRCALPRKAAATGRWLFDWGSRTLDSWSHVPCHGCRVRRCIRIRDQRIRVASRECVRAGAIHEQRQIVQASASGDIASIARAASYRRAQAQTPAAHTTHCTPQHCGATPARPLRLRQARGSSAPFGLALCRRRPNRKGTPRPPCRQSPAHCFDIQINDRSGRAQNSSATRRRSAGHGE